MKNKKHERTYRLTPILQETSDNEANEGILFN